MFKKKIKDGQRNYLVIILFSILLCISPITSINGKNVMGNGNHTKINMLNNIWDIYDDDQKGLPAIILQDGEGRPYFSDSNNWWYGVWANNYFHGMYGWRPFLNSTYREIDFTSLNYFFDTQASTTTYDVTEGNMPIYVNHNGPLYWAEYSNNDNGFGEKDLLFKQDIDVDAQFLTIISASDHLLFERKLGKINLWYPKMLKTIKALDRVALTSILDSEGNRPHWGELPIGGYQGSIIEYAHRYNQYRSTTLVYAIVAYDRLIQLAELSGDAFNKDLFINRKTNLISQVPDFLRNGEWFIGGKSQNLDKIYGNGDNDGSTSSYFETYPNIDAIMLGVTNATLSDTILSKIESIPQLNQYAPILINYPARPEDETLNKGGICPEGIHVNGGWWWMTASSAIYSYVKQEHPKSFEYLQRLWEDKLNNYSYDFYDDFGGSKYSVDGSTLGESGAFGFVLRGLFDVQPYANNLKLSPHIWGDVSNLSFNKPVYWGGKQIFIEITNNDYNNSIKSVLLNNLPYEDFTETTVNLAFNVLNDNNTVKINAREEEELTDKILIACLNPPVDSILTPGETVTFEATVNFTLVSKETSFIELQIYDQSEILIGFSDSISVGQGSDSAWLTVTCTIPEDVTEINMFALLFLGEAIEVNIYDVELFEVERARIYSAQLTDVEAPLQIRPGETLNIALTVDYKFSEPTEVSSGLFDVASEDWIAEEYETLEGDGLKIYSFELIAPEEETIWSLEASVWYYVGDEWIHDEDGYVEAFEIAVIVEEEDDKGGGGIPGFPVEVIVLGLTVAVLIQFYKRRDPSFSLRARSSVSQHPPHIFRYIFSTWIE